MTLPAPPPAPEEHRSPCDRCGADFRFDPAVDRLICDHCGNERPVDGSGRHTRAIRELDFRAALEARLTGAEIEEPRVLHCPNCGAQLTPPNARSAPRPWLPIQRPSPDTSGRAACCPSRLTSARRMRR